MAKPTLFWSSSKFPDEASACVAPRRQWSDGAGRLPLRRSFRAAVVRGGAAEPRLPTAVLLLRALGAGSAVRRFLILPPPGLRSRSSRRGARSYGTDGRWGNLRRLGCRDRNSERWWRKIPVLGFGTYGMAGPRLQNVLVR